MTLEDFFDHIETQYHNQLPFIAYRKPNRLKVKAMLQKTDKIHITKEFNETGFVFSPFDDKEANVLIPSEESDFIYTDYNISESDAVTEAFGIVEAPSTYKNVSYETKQQHINLIKKGIEAINNNQFEKVVLSRQEASNLSEYNPISILKNLLNIYVSAFVYCWYHPKVGLWLGATPETLLKIEGNRFTMMALAGTQDYKGTLDVIWQEKEKKEQLIVTDFVVNHLTPLVNNIKVSDIETVKAGNLLHLKTMITAQLKSEASDLKQVISLLHPTPAVCGLPKQVAKKFILENENYKRGFYTGFIGELNFEVTRTPRSGTRNIENRAYSITKKTTQLYVNLRCMQIKDNTALLYIGGGITKASNPENEWQETVSKSMIIKNIL